MSEETLSVSNRLSIALQRKRFTVNHLKLFLDKWAGQPEFVKTCSVSYTDGDTIVTVNVSRDCVAKIHRDLDKNGIPKTQRELQEQTDVQPFS